MRDLTCGPVQMVADRLGRVRGVIPGNQGERLAVIELAALVQAQAVLSRLAEKLARVEPLKASLVDPSPVWSGVERRREVHARRVVGS
jgi:hypothetical protein